jgi:4-hydroxybenzoate polyprenyltransferase
MGFDSVKQWLKLVRLQTGAATAITAVFGAILLMPKDNLDILHLTLLFIIGLLFHSFGFALNEYSDIEVDRHSKYLSDKPLLKGTIKKRHALYAAFVFISIASAMAVVFFTDIWALTAFFMAILLGAVYDLYGKRFFGADIVLGAFIFFFTLFGALSVSRELTPVVYITAFLFFIQLSFQTGITGGMKDIPHDHIAGAKTSPVYLGCRVVGRRLFVTGEFRAYAYITKAVHTVVLLLPFWLLLFELQEPVLLQLTILFILILLMWATTVAALNQTIFDRLKIMRLLGAQEVVTYPTVSILVMGVIGIWAALFLMSFPIFWMGVFLYMIYGKFMPDV